MNETTGKTNGFGSFSAIRGIHSGLRLGVTLGITFGTPPFQELIGNLIILRSVGMCKEVQPAMASSWPGKREKSETG